MEFSQHVYGRVARGFRGNSEGYQLAAVSDTIADRIDLLEGLNRFSFFRFRNGSGSEARYSFYRPSKGYLAFGCSRYAPDGTGSVGAFAHHYVCTEEQFLRSRLSPIRLLRSLPFRTCEADLPSDRSLEVVDFDLPETERSAGAWQTFALQILDFFLGKAAAAIPLVVASDDDTWAILGDLFSLLPRLEASRLSFSTLFTEATEFVDGFRLVFVPDSIFIPPETSLYRVLNPKEGSLQQPKPVPLTSFFREYPADGGKLLRFVDCMRHAQEKNDDEAPLFQELVSRGRIFRECIDALKLPDLSAFVLKKKDWIVSYCRAGEQLQYKDVSAVLKQNPGTYLAPWIGAMSQLDRTDLVDPALEEYVRSRRDGPTDQSVLESLNAIHALDRFMQAAERCADSERLCELAEILSRKNYYRSQLHYIIAARILQGFAGSNARRDLRTERWLLEEANVRLSDPFLQAVADFSVWIDLKKKESYRLNDYDLGAKHYFLLLDTLWNLGDRFPGVRDLVSVLFSARHRECFFSFLESKFIRLDYSTQKELLKSIVEICIPTAADNGHLIRAISKSESASGLAKYYSEYILKTKPVDEMALHELESILRSSKRWPFSGGCT